VIIWLFRQVLHARKAFGTHDTPRQLALGFAAGMVLGLLPKGNLLAVGVASAILMTRVNLGTAAIAALAFSVVGHVLDPLTDPLGSFVLSAEALRPTWKRLYDMPLAPWTSFNNTVVLGSFLLGLFLFYPAYATSLAAFCRGTGRAARKPKPAAAPPATRRRRRRGARNRSSAPLAAVQRGDPLLPARPRIATQTVVGQAAPNASAGCGENVAAGREPAAWVNGVEILCGPPATERHLAWNETTTRPDSLIACAYVSLPATTPPTSNCASKSAVPPMHWMRSTVVSPRRATA
jgi:uncharacterized protein (TIGR03546 family)